MSSHSDPFEAFNEVLAAETAQEAQFTSSELEATVPHGDVFGYEPARDARRGLQYSIAWLRSQEIMRELGSSDEINSDPTSADQQLAVYGHEKNIAGTRLFDGYPYYFVAFQALEHMRSSFASVNREIGNPFELNRRYSYSIAQSALEFVTKAYTVDEAQRHVSIDTELPGDPMSRTLDIRLTYDVSNPVWKSRIQPYSQHPDSTLHDTNYVVRSEAVEHTGDRVTSMLGTCQSLDLATATLVHPLQIMEGLQKPTEFAWTIAHALPHGLLGGNPRPD